MNRLFDTDAGLYSPVVLRLTLALVMWPHGAQKAFGWFGGYGFGGTQSYFTETLGMPWLLGLSVIVIELVGPALLLVGAGTRFAAVGFIAVMIGAITVGGHASFGFFVDWFGSQGGQGVELHLLLIGAALSLVFTGGGALSLDGRLGAKPEGS